MSTLERIALALKKVVTIEIDSTTSISSLFLDPLDLYEFVVALEDEFAVKVEDSFVESAVTIGDFITYFEKQ
jgi:acyl carrier protein